MQNRQTKEQMYIKDTTDRNSLVRTYIQHYQGISHTSQSAKIPAMYYTASTLKNTAAEFVFRKTTSEVSPKHITNHNRTPRNFKIVLHLCQLAHV